MSIETGKAELEIEKKFVGCANSFIICPPFADISVGQ
jgi:hypothetical protein